MELRGDSGTLTIAGCSIPENADRVFQPLHEAIERYAAAPAAKTVVRIALTYFNSSSAKCLLDVLKRFEDLHAAGATKVTLEWVHGPDDLDMKEAGVDYRSLLEFPVKLVEDIL
ncbi:MAG: DUF1987 domain-containing protein [Flavobacteriales bacterium]|nr:DUF1987 domain-containing protein [Flavobacteriales bacterium]